MIKNNKKNNCPICDNYVDHIFVSKHNRDILFCMNCEHYFTPPINEDQGICPRENNIESESDRDLDLFHKRNVGLLRLFLRKLKSQNKNTYNFLDFGAGNAHISRTFKKILGDKCNLYCLEANPLCNNLYLKYNLIHIYSIEEIKCQIDLIYMVEVIEHLVDPVAVLSELSKLIGKNGLIFLSTPLGDADESRTNAFDTESHLHFFTERSLNTALELAGLAPIDYKYYPEMYVGIKKKFSIQSIINIVLSKILTIMTNLRLTKVKHLVGFTFKK